MILAYHRVNPWRRNDALSVAPERFRRQISFLLNRGWTATPLTVEMPPRAFAVTFDDGFFDNYRWALPILEELKVPATVFLAAGYVGTRDLLPRYRNPEEDRFLTWEEVREMAGRGISFGAHGLRHERLPLLTDAEAERVIRDSRSIIEERAGTQVSFFCYPYGEFTDATIGLVQNAGYSGAVVTPTRPVAEGPYTMIRIGIYSHTSHLAYRMKLWKDALRKRTRCCSLRLPS